MESRVERVARKQNMTEDEARKTIERVDKMRENYVKKYTGTSRYDTRNYQLVISADGKTEEEMAFIYPVVHIHRLMVFSRYECTR
jgi:cytidylate kinase